MEIEQCLVLETNGFIMNAGILGFLRVLDHVQAVKGQDYDYNEYQLWIDKNYLLQLDLAQAYIETCNEQFYPLTHYARILTALKKVPHLAEQVKNEANWTKAEKTVAQQGVTEVLKPLESLVATKSLSNACAWLQAEGVLSENLPELIKQAKKAKEFTEKIQLLELIEKQLLIPKVRETLCTVGVALRALSPFWVNKAFIKNSQGNIVVLSDQNMVDLLRDGVVQAFKDQLTTTAFTDKICPECDHPIPKNQKPANLSFMNDIADDISKKPSAFWNFDKTQAFLCDQCAFLYLLMPLGFTSMGNELVFVNANTTIETLWLANQPLSGIVEMSNLTWTRICQQVIQRCIKKQVLQSDNIQVVIRTTEKSNQSYHFEVLSYDALAVLHESRNLLEGLSKCYSFKLSSGDYWNVSESVILSILNHEPLYPIVHRLLRLSLDSTYETSARIQLPLVFAIQQNKRSKQLQGGTGMNSNQLYYGTKNAMADGKKLNHHLTYVAKKDVGSVMYRLLNALQTNNKHDFLNTVLRLHTSYGLGLSTDFIKLLNEPSFFKDMGYAYLLGLKGVSDKNQSNEENEGVVNHD